jgi:hypothetical protein
MSPKLQLGEHSGPIHIHTYRVDYELGSPRGLELRVRALSSPPARGLAISYNLDELRDAIVLPLTGEPRRSLGAVLYGRI